MYNIEEKLTARPNSSYLGIVYNSSDGIFYLLIVEFCVRKNSPTLLFINSVLKGNCNAFAFIIQLIPQTLVPI